MMMIRTAQTPPCPHKPACPPATAPDRYRAHILAAHPEQGWSLLCNGVIAFDDLGGLLPDASALVPSANLRGTLAPHAA